MIEEKYTKEQIGSIEDLDFMGLSRTEIEESLNIEIPLEDYKLLRRNFDKYSSRKKVKSKEHFCIEEMYRILNRKNQVKPGRSKIIGTVECPYCGQEMKSITNVHLLKCNDSTIQDLLQEFPGYQLSGDRV